MNIYTDYVFDDKIISPINGYVCRRITRQNIKQFGCESIAQLHTIYPDFPLMCKMTKDRASLGAYSERSNLVRDLQRKKRQHEKSLQEKHYYENPKYCKKCGGTILFELRNNTHCSRTCSNSRVHSDEVKMKIGKSVKNCKNRKKSNRQKQFESTLIAKVCYECNTVVRVNPRKIRNDEMYYCDNAMCKEKVLHTIRVNTGRIAGKK